ncbi:hypothetical protein SOPP22_08500 [Shewanella sp. OPT22]|nr:hypothetical protein SOPP22_08500 [Shewanella sp. OPT22]
MESPSTYKTDIPTTIPSYEVESDNGDNFDVVDGNEIEFLTVLDNAVQSLNKIHDRDELKQAVDCYCKSVKASIDGLSASDKKKLFINSITLLNWLERTEIDEKSTIKLLQNLSEVDKGATFSDELSKTLSHLWLVLVFGVEVYTQMCEAQCDLFLKFQGELTDGAKRQEAKHKAYLLNQQNKILPVFDESNLKAATQLSNNAYSDFLTIVLSPANLYYLLKSENTANEQVMADLKFLHNKIIGKLEVIELSEIICEPNPFAEFGFPCNTEDSDESNCKLQLIVRATSLSVYDFCGLALVQSDGNSFTHFTASGLSLVQCTDVNFNIKYRMLIHLFNSADSVEKFSETLKFISEWVEAGEGSADEVLNIASFQFMVINKLQRFNDPASISELSTLIQNSPWLAKIVFKYPSDISLRVTALKTFIACKSASLSYGNYFSIELIKCLEPDELQQLPQKIKEELSFKVLAEKGNLELLKKIWQSHIPFDITNRDGETLLFLAFKGGLSEVLSLIDLNDVEFYKHRDYRGNSLYHALMHSFREDRLKALLCAGFDFHHKNDEEVYPITLCIKAGYMSGVVHMLEVGNGTMTEDRALESQRLAIKSIIENKKYKMLSAIVGKLSPEVLTETFDNQGEKLTLLQIAAKRGESKLVKTLRLLSPQSVNIVSTSTKGDVTALDLAAINGHLEAFSQLWMNGARRESNTLGTYQDLLMKSIQKGAVKIPLMIAEAPEYHVSAKQRKNNYGALHQAAYSGAHELIGQLIDKYQIKGDILVICQQGGLAGWNCLHIAIEKKRVKALEQLLMHVPREGLESRTQCKFKMSPIMMAVKYKSLPIVKLLVQAGAKINTVLEYDDSALNSLQAGKKYTLEGLAEHYGASDIVEYLKSERK